MKSKANLEANMEVEQALRILVDVIKKYNDSVEIITTQKPFAEIEHDEIEQELNANTVKASKLRETLKEKKIEIEYVDEVLQSLIEASQAFTRIVSGLGDKAQRRGKYGWLTYRGDTKTHDQKRKVFLDYVSKFSSTIQEEEAEDEFIMGKAKILDPKSDEPYETEIEILKSHYDESKDEQGYVYIVRSYEAGKPKDVTTPKEFWEQLAPAFTYTEEQRKADTDKIMKDILGDK